MPLNANALCTLAQCKSYLDIPSGETAQDARLEQFINSASSMIENYLDRQLIYQTHIERHDGRNNDMLLLKQWPAEKPTEIASDFGWDFEASSVIESQYYEMDQEVMVVFKNMHLPRGNRNIKVTYNAGYKSVVTPAGGPNLPAEINLACIMLVAFHYQFRTDRRLGVQSKSKSGESITYVKGIPIEITSLLDLHMRMELPFTSTAVGNL